MDITNCAILYYFMLSSEPANFDTFDNYSFMLFYLIGLSFCQLVALVIIIMRIEQVPLTMATTPVERENDIAK